MPAGPSPLRADGHAPVARSPATVCSASEVTAESLREDQVWPLAEVVTRLRRALRASVRSEFAWERLPMAQIELMQRLADEPQLRVKDLAERHRLATNTVSQLVQQLVT